MKELDKLIIGIDICYIDREKEEIFNYCIVEEDGDGLSIIDLKTFINRDVYLDKRPSDVYITILRKLYPNAVIIQENN